MATLDAGASTASFTIEELQKTPEHDALIWRLWTEIFPDWAIDKERTSTLFHSPYSCKCFVHEHGFAIGQPVVDGWGKIAVVGVLPEHRRKGLGSALMRKARTYIDEAYKSRDQKMEGLGLGSSFPRFWYRVPAGLPQGVKDFFMSQGFHEITDSNAQRPKDFFKDIRSEIVPPAIAERVSKVKLDIKFSLLTPELSDECLQKQKANFSWWRGYEVMINYKQGDEVLVALDAKTNEQIGWLLMPHARSMLGSNWAFAYWMPSREKTGMISAVGIDPSARGRGVGLAIVARAMEIHRERGMEGVFIDGVVIVDYYEKLGFRAVIETEDWRLT